MPTDSWGRSVRYCQQFSKEASQDPREYTVTSSFLEHPVSKDSTSACLILKQFLDSHWKDGKCEAGAHFDDGGDNVFERIEGQMNSSL